MLFLMQFSFLFFGFVTSIEQEPKLRPEIASLAGTFRGEILTAVSGAEFASYRGIPFAIPPIGDKRFALPEPFPRIENVVYDASDFGPMCVQSLDGVTYGEEDCLYLNVYTPIKNSEDDHTKKVLVFIHGGGFVIGASNSYVPGDLVTEGDVVVVTFNYRLGWLGFLRGNNQSLPGNQAFWDQVLALKWVKNNILAFGGDPDDVTLSGESAGSLSVSVLSILPQTKDLFKKGLLMSGTAFSFPTPPRTSTDLLEIISSKVGCGSQSDIVLCLKQQPIKSFQMAFTSAMMANLPSSGDALIPHSIPELVKDIEYLEKVGFRKRSYIVSVMKHDGYVRVNSLFGKIDTTSLEASIQDTSRLLQLPVHVTESLLLEYMRSYKELERAVIAINTDFFYLKRSNHFLEAYLRLSLEEKEVQNNNVFFMSFDPAPKYFPKQYAVHAVDLLYLFDLDLKGFLESFYFVKIEGEMSDDDFQLKADYIKLIAGFMKTGNSNEYLTREKNIKWAPYDNTKKSYLSFSLQPYVGEDLFGGRRLIWDELVRQWKSDYESLQVKQEL